MRCVGSSHAVELQLALSPLPPLSDGGSKNANEYKMRRGGARYPVKTLHPDLAQLPQRSLVLLGPGKKRHENHGRRQPRQQAAEPALPVMQAVLVQEHLRMCTGNTPSIDIFLYSAKWRLGEAISAASSARRAAGDLFQSAQGLTHQLHRVE